MKYGILVLLALMFASISIVKSEIDIPAGANFRLDECSGFDNCPGYWDEMSVHYNAQGQPVWGQYKCFPSTQENECRCYDFVTWWMPSYVEWIPAPPPEYISSYWDHFPLINPNTGNYE